MTASKAAAASGINVGRNGGAKCLSGTIETGSAFKMAHISALFHSVLPECQPPAKVIGIRDPRLGVNAYKMNADAVTLRPRICPPIPPQILVA